MTVHRNSSPKKRGFLIKAFPLKFQPKATSIVKLSTNMIIPGDAVCLATPKIEFSSGQDKNYKPTHILDEYAPACDSIAAFICGLDSVEDCSMILDYGCNVRITSVLLTNSVYLAGVSVSFLIVFKNCFKRVFFSVHF